MHQIDYELTVIEQLGFPGYFLLLHDIVEFCRRSDIYCQGRGSAANSAVCYALGVTKADAVDLGLLFERFLSPERDGPPDIDLDIEHQRREEVIQYVYERYGRDRAAQVANVITYRPRSALREMAKAAGVAPGQADALGKWVDRWAAGPEAFGELVDATPEPASNTASTQPNPTPVRKGARYERRFERTEQDRSARRRAARRAARRTRARRRSRRSRSTLAAEVIDFPRHLGIHSGGMVMADRPLLEFCPIEWARMEGRSVLQWDKDDCAAAGLVKFDLLGLGMLTMLHIAVDLVREYEGVDVDLATIPQENEVYDLLCAADTVGVFQVESRAQMATLPRLRPRNFYDLVVEVALIRPGPIQGGSVHPYLRRRNGEEEITYIHPLTEPCLKKTLGVPLFQEQLMQLAVDCAGFSAAEADQLRQAMGSKRSQARMARMRERLMEGHGRARHHRRHRRGDLHEAGGVLELRVPREPLGELRLPRVLELVDQVPLLRGVRGRVAERAADGLLLAAHDRARRAPPRRAGARPRSQRVAPRRDARAAHRRCRAGRPAGARLPRRAVAPRGAARAAIGARAARRAARPHRRRAGRPPVHRPRRLRAAHRRDRRPGGGARDRGHVRALLRPVAPLGVVGRGRARHRPPQRAARRHGQRDPARRRHRHRRAVAAGHDRDGDGRRRAVGDGAQRRQAPHRVRARRAARARAWSPRPTSATSPTAAWWRSPGS